MIRRLLSQFLVLLKHKVSLSLYSILEGKLEGKRETNTYYVIIVSNIAYKQLTYLREPEYLVKRNLGKFFYVLGYQVKS